jgi:GLPGLI family protein
MIFMKLLFSFLLLFLTKTVAAQENTFIGKIDYVKERKLLSGEYMPRDNGESETFFNSTAYAFFQKSIIDIEAMVDKQMKLMQKEVMVDSFEVARQRAKIRRQLESQINGGITYKTIINFSSNVAQRVRKNDDASYCVIDSLVKIAWQLKEDTMTIDGLLCQKARGFFIDKYYDVWFAPSVPFAAGPLKMYGLPGVIVLATSEDDKTRYRMKTLTYPLTTPIIVSGCNGEKKISGYNYTLAEAKRMKETRQNIEEMKKNDAKNQ